MIEAIDRQNLYGQVAYPKHHSRDQVPAIYRWAASRRGLFVNPALTEPFGLTLIEAAGCGLPVVATNDGGSGARRPVVFFFPREGRRSSTNHE